MRPGQRSGPCAFGADLKRSSTKSSEQVMLDFEARIGRKLASPASSCAGTRRWGTYEPVARGERHHADHLGVLEADGQHGRALEQHRDGGAGSTRHNEIVGWARKIRS
jgi:hypothetical protein